MSSSYNAFGFGGEKKKGGLRTAPTIVFLSYIGRVIRLRLKILS
jgi:hypothetical protein